MEVAHGERWMVATAGDDGGGQRSWIKATAVVDGKRRRAVVADCGRWTVAADDAAAGGSGRQRRWR